MERCVDDPAWNTASVRRGSAGDRLMVVEVTNGEWAAGDKRQVPNIRNLELIGSIRRRALV